MPYSACVRCTNCDGFPCVVHGKSDADVLGVRPALEHDERRRCSRTRTAVKLETNADGTAVTEVVVERDGELERYSRRPRRARLRRGQHREAAARLRERPAPARARERLRPGRPQLHVPQQPGRARALAGREPDGLPEDARPERLLLRAATGTTTRSATSRWSASRRRRCSAARSRCETRLAPQWSLERVARHAVDFWLSTEDLPMPGEPGHGRRRRAS